MPKEIISEITSEVIKYVRAINEKKIKVAIIMAAIILGIYLNWGNAETIIFAIFIASILNPVNSRYFAAPALFFLALTPFLLILNRQEKAEEFAIYAYYFLVIALISGFQEIRKENSDKIL